MFRGSGNLRARTAVVLVDAPAVIHRSYHTWNYYYRNKRDPTEHMLRSISHWAKFAASIPPPSDHSPGSKNESKSGKPWRNHVVLCWDCGSRARQKEDATYKAQRPAKDVVLSAGLAAAEEWMDSQERTTGGELLVSAPNAALRRVISCEADDVMFTAAQRLRPQLAKLKPAIPLILLTHDHDLLEMLDKQTFFYHLGRKGWFHSHEVKAEYGVEAKQVGDWKAFVGDHSDNVTGVPGIGEKSATLLLRKYKTLQRVLDEAPRKEKGALARRVEEGREEALRLRGLLSLRMVPEVVPHIDKVARLIG